MSGPICQAAFHFQILGLEIFIHFSSVPDFTVQVSNSV